MDLFTNAYAGLGTFAGADPKVVSAIRSKTMQAYRTRVARPSNYAGRYGEAVNKTLRRTPQFDTNYFKICDGEDPGLRYGIWNTDEDVLINLLRPITNKAAEQNVTYIDFRSATDDSLVKGNTDWCAVPTFAARDPLGKCVLRYCTDFNIHYTATRETLSPNDFATKCIRDTIFDMNGNAITNEEDWLRYLLLSDMQQSMFKEIIDGTDNHTNSWAKGIRAWFDDFASDHSTELASTCSWMAPSVVSAEILCAEVGEKIEYRLKALREMTRDMRVQGTGRQMTVEASDFVLILSETSAECVIKCHVCQEVCGRNLELSAMNVQQLKDWKQLYPSFLYGGRFGQGYITTPNGLVIDIIRSRRVTDDEMFLLFLGNEADPEGGLRLQMHDYSDYIAYLGRNDQMVGAMNPYSLYGGAVVMLQSSDLCGNRYARWGWQLYDKRPWMQTRWTDLNTDACTVPAPVSISNLPNAAGAATNC